MRSTATSSRMSAGTASSTRPLRAAERALTWRPVSIMSSASGSPTSRGSRWVPPPPGNSPSWTSGRPSRVWPASVQMRASQAMASSSPPPRQTPSIAATTGTRSPASRSNTRWAVCETAVASSALSQARIMPMSAPAMNEPGLALMKISPRRPPSAAISSRICPAAFTASPPRVFWLCPGQSIHTRAIPSSRRSRRRGAGVSVACSIVSVMPPPAPSPPPVRRRRRPWSVRCRRRGGAAPAGSGRSFAPRSRRRGGRRRWSRR
ncbi:hypothetical protein KBTX_03810 [wastewater metagenome]|uniref:Uncharacterized protein n=2 Tax=unclassified sequences TaxID=12908 RepID=A0A5B8REL0_9ZZZZ|nr:hypothetical protein KBTEX_03810 [uncultured organism]